MNPQNNPWQYQIRINLRPEFAAMARNDLENPALRPLTNILTKHRATLHCQFDAFVAYVDEAEKKGSDAFPLYKWTHATINDEAKKEKYLRSFALHVNGEGLYMKDIADALESDLRSQVDGPLIADLFKRDTNPANNPQPPAQFR
jgi:hypothetical protein